jgi:hypothetical protein
MLRYSDCADGWGIVNGCKLAGTTRLTADLEAEPVQTNGAEWPDAERELAALEAEISLHEATDAGAWSGAAAAAIPFIAPAVYAAAAAAEDAGPFAGAEVAAVPSLSFAGAAEGVSGIEFGAESAPAPPLDCTQYVVTLRCVIVLTNQNPDLHRCVCY